MKAPAKTNTASELILNADPIKQIERAITKQLGVVLDLQASGEFDHARALLEGLIETGKKHHISLIEIIESLRVTVVSSSILLGNHKSYSLLTTHGLSRNLTHRPNKLIACIYARDFINTRNIFHGGSPGEIIMDKLLGRDKENAGTYQLPQNINAIAKALVATQDVKFITDVVGDIFSAAQIALAQGDGEFAKQILISVRGIDRDVIDPFPAIMQPPPAYTRE